MEGGAVLPLGKGWDNLRFLCIDVETCRVRGQPPEMGRMVYQQGAEGTIRNHVDFFAATTR